MVTPAEEFLVVLQEHLFHGLGEEGCPAAVPAEPIGTTAPVGSFKASTLVHWHYTFCIKHPHASSGS